MRQDLALALRILARNPAFTAVAVLSLALGIGANTAIFTLVDAVLLKSLPVKDPERLAVFARNPERPSPSLNYPDYEYIRDHNQSFSGFAASGGGWSLIAMRVAGEGASASSSLVTVNLVSGNYFDVLGVTPAVGRVLHPDDNLKEDGHPWAVLDYDFWQRRFGGDARVVGRDITLNGSPFKIVGVARSGFTGANVGQHPNVYAPIMMYRSVYRSVGQWNRRTHWWLTGLGRLKDGVTLESATPEANVLWRQILAADPRQRPPRAYDKDYEKRNRALLLPGAGGYSYMRNQIRKPLQVLMIVVALVLLIACANVANLLLARAVARTKEVAIRLSVGASRAQLIRQFLLETTLLSLLGGVAGLGFAWWGVRVLLRFMPSRGVPLDFNLAPDWRLLGFSFGVSLLVGLLAGLAPALQGTRPDLTAALKNELTAPGRSRFDLRRGLVVLQVAVSLLLLIGAGLFIRSLRNLRTLDAGFDRESVLLVDVNPQQLGYKGQRLRDFYDRLLERLQAMPGVRHASLANITPQAGSRWNNDLSVLGYQRPADEEPYVDMNAVSPGYFSSLGIPLLLGRDFRPADNPLTTAEQRDDEKLGPPAPVAIVNEAMAKKYWAGRSPIGGRFTLGDKFDAAKTFEVIGVVKDSRYFNLRDAVKSMVYFPVWRFGAGSNTVCIRSQGDPAQLVSAVRREVAALDAAVPVLGTTTLEEQFDSVIAQERTVSSLCGFFGALAALLSAVGLYGVMAHAVTRRYRELGIRLALGAEPGSVLRLILRDTAWMVGAGALIGLPIALGLTRLVESFLYGLTPQDPASIALATLTLLCVTGLAGYLPARRATKIDPMRALRYD